MIGRLTDGFFSGVWDSFFMLIPLAILFAVFQAIYLRLPRRQVIRIFSGFGWTAVGLSLFLHGIRIGFVDAGRLLGRALAETAGGRWLIPAGLILGFVVTLAEPAVRVLNIEVERVTAGHIHRRILGVFLASGVALAVGLSMVRIVTGLSLGWFLIPGYALALVLAHRVPPVFTAIAFDAGGVVTGPMIATFVLSLCLSAALVLDGQGAIGTGFGMIALVALIPILSLQGLGWLYAWKSRNSREQRAVSDPIAPAVGEGKEKET